LQILTPSLLIPANYQTHANVILNHSIVTLNEVKSLGVNSVKDLKKKFIILNFYLSFFICYYG